MNVYRISKCIYIRDLSGIGASNFPGRWNSKGTHVLYTAATPSLAMLESIVHIAKIPVEGFCMAVLSIPDNSILDIDKEQLPGDWPSYPAPEALKAIGDKFIRTNKYLAARLPSAIMPEDAVYLLNPMHPLFKKVVIQSVRNLDFDSRLAKFY